MDAQKNAPQGRPSGRKPSSPERRLGAAQRWGLALCGLTLALGLFANSPLGHDLLADGSGQEVALYLVALGANVGSVLCAVGLVLRNPPAAWGGAGGFVAVSFLFTAAWYAAPLALAMLACVLAWEALRPHPAPPALPPWPPPMPPMAPMPAAGPGYGSWPPPPWMPGPPR